MPKAEPRPLNEWIMSMRPLSIALGIAATLLGLAAAAAQAWPSRPITIVVPFRPVPHSISLPGRLVRR